MYRNLYEDIKYKRPEFELMSPGEKIRGTWGFIPPTAKWSQIIPVVVKEDSAGNSWRVYIFSKKGREIDLDLNSNRIDTQGRSIYSEQMRDIKRLMKLAENMNLRFEYGGDQEDLYESEENDEFGSLELEGDVEGISKYFGVDKSKNSMDFKTCLLFCVDIVKKNADGTGSSINSFVRN